VSSPDTVARSWCEPANTSQPGGFLWSNSSRATEGPDDFTERVSNVNGKAHAVRRQLKSIHHEVFAREDDALVVDRQAKGHAPDELEVGIQNGGMATGLAFNVLQSAQAAMGSAVFGPWSAVTSSMLASWWRRSADTAGTA